MGDPGTYVVVRRSKKDLSAKAKNALPLLSTLSTARTTIINTNITEETNAGCCDNTEKRQERVEPGLMIDPHHLIPLVAMVQAATTNDHQAATYNIATTTIQHLYLW